MLKKHDFENRINKLMVALEETIHIAAVAEVSEGFINGQNNEEFDSVSGSLYADFQELTPYLVSAPDLIYNCMELIQTINDSSDKKFSKMELTALLQPIRKSVASFLLM